MRRPTTPPLISSPFAHSRTHYPNPSRWRLPAQLLLSLLLTLASVSLFAALAQEQPSADATESTVTGKAKADPSAASEPKVIVMGLNNPSGISFSPEGLMTVCDSGAGRVVLVRERVSSDYVNRFETQYWKVNENAGIERYRLGPLSAVWAGETLAVTDGGKQDGEETVLFFKKAGMATDGEASNPVGPTTEDEADLGEGNLTGMSLSRDGKTLYVCGQGYDGKTWVLKCDVATRKLEPFLSADDHGISTNSPMQTLPWGENSLLVLYSGGSEAPEGRLVEWDLETREPLRQWTLPGLISPFGMDRIPGTNQLAIVENNWSLTEVRTGRLVVATLPEEGGEAGLEVVTDQLMGPTACKFGPAGETLYIAQLGETFDDDKGSIVAVEGLVPLTDLTEEPVDLGESAPQSTKPSPSNVIVSEGKPTPEAEPANP